MTHEITVFGHSDKLIRAKFGGFEKELEASPHEEDRLLVGNTEIVIDIKIPGKWRVEIPNDGGDDDVEHHPIGSNHEAVDNDYTEAVTVETEVPRVEML